NRNALHATSVAAFALSVSEMNAMEHSSHVSIRIRDTIPLRSPPTAVQELDETQATPKRKSGLVPRLGLGTIDQLVPFQVSIRVWAPLFIEPTAVQKLNEAQETLER